MIPYILFDIFVARCGYSLSRIKNMASTNVRGGAVYWVLRNVGWKAQQGNELNDSNPNFVLMPYDMLRLKGRGK